MDGQENQDLISLFALFLLLLLLLFFLPCRCFFVLLSEIPMLHFEGD